MERWRLEVRIPLLHLNDRRVQDARRIVISLYYIWNLLLTRIA
jgi:hypothetical protein